MHDMHKQLLEETMPTNPVAVHEGNSSEPAGETQILMKFFKDTIENMEKNIQKNFGRLEKVTADTCSRMSEVEKRISSIEDMMSKFPESSSYQVLNWVNSLPENA